MAGQRVADPQRITSLYQMIAQCHDDTAVIESLTEKQGAGATLVVASPLNWTLKKPLQWESRNYAFIHGEWSS
jgi:hypothetical protein